MSCSRSPDQVGLCALIAEFSATIVEVLAEGSGTEMRPGDLIARRSDSSRILFGVARAACRMTTAPRIPCGAVVLSGPDRAALR